MKTPHPRRQRGFSLVETIIAIGVLTVLLTGFLIVFAPAAAGIRRAISVQEADRLTSTVEQELVTYRGEAGYGSGFNKAFEWIRDSNQANSALLVYQYRGSLSSRRADGTPQPVADATGGRPGVDFTVQSIVRRKGDPAVTEDLKALDGGIYVVKCTQLVFSGGEMIPGTPGQIVDPRGGGTGGGSADEYPEAVIAFAAEFYALPARSPEYLAGPFGNFFQNARNPVFVRNLAVRR